MAFGLGDILQTLQQGVQAMNNLREQISTTFPQASAVSTSATTGTATLTSSQPAAFLSVTTSSGATFKVALYNS